MTTQYLDNIFIPSIGAIGFLIIFGVLVWIMFSPSYLGVNSKISLVKYIILLSLLYPIYSILEYMLLRS